MLMLISYESVRVKTTWHKTFNQFVKKKKNNTPFSPKLAVLQTKFLGYPWPLKQFLCVEAMYDIFIVLRLAFSQYFLNYCNIVSKLCVVTKTFYLAWKSTYFGFACAEHRCQADHVYQYIFNPHNCNRKYNSKDGCSHTVMSVLSRRMHGFFFWVPMWRTSFTSRCLIRQAVGVRLPIFEQKHVVWVW